MSETTRQSREAHAPVHADAVEALRAVAVAFDELGQLLAAPEHPHPFDAIAATAVHKIPAAATASVTTWAHGHFTTAAAVDDRARRADAIQYELGSGPCLDAIVSDSLYRPRDLLTDPRWPEYGRRVAQELGLRSMLSYRMTLRHEPVIAGLNVYACSVDAFDEQAAATGLLLATHGAQAAAAAISGDRAEHLERALRTNREIGAAMGVLMAQHKLTQDQAFNLLRIASQNTNRKLHEVALDVIDTGALDVVAPASRPDVDPS
jgi:hypothetical protein